MNELNLIVIGSVAGLITGLSGILVGGFTIFFTTKNGQKKSQGYAAANSLAIIAYTAMLVLCFCLLTALFLDGLSVDNLQAISVAIPLLTVMLGLALVRRYFWRSPIIEIEHHKKHLKKQLKRQNMLAQPLLTAASLLYSNSLIIVANITLLALLGLLSSGSALYWSVAYATGLITPLYVTTALLSTKTSPAELLKWQDSTHGTTFLYIGLWCIFLAWLVLYYTIVNGAYIS